MLKSIYKGGSSVVLSKPNDVDYFCYYDTVEERREAVIKNKDHTKDVHCKLWDNRLNIFLGCYAYRFMELIEGEEIKEFKTFNICDHKEEYIEKAKRYVETMKDNDKRWYHIVIACYMFESGKNKLLVKQKKVAQEVHDNGITPELKEWCKQIILQNK